VSGAEQDITTEAGPVHPRRRVSLLVRQGSGRWYGPRLLGLLARFWGWWTRELKSMLPPRVRDWLRRDEQTLVVVAGRDGAAVRLFGGGNAGHWADIPPPQADAATKAEALLRRRGWPTAPSGVALKLPAADVLRLSLDLPAATEENLTEVLAFEMDRNTPFTADQVYFGHDVASRDRQRRRIRVELRVVPRRVVEPWREWLEQLDIAPTLVGAPAADAGTRLEAIECGLPRIARRSSLQGAVRWTAATTVLLAVIASLALPLYELHGRARALEARVVQARAEAARVRQTLDEIRRLRARAQFLVDRKSQAPTVVELLAEVARIFPDGTWVSRFELANGEVRLQGESRSASALIAMVEGSPLFRDAQFASPVTRNQSTDRDRFVIAARLEGGRSFPGAAGNRTDEAGRSASVGRGPSSVPATGGGR